MKRILFATVISIFMSTGTILFLKNNNKSTSVHEDKITIKGNGEFLYPFGIVFDKGVHVNEVVNRMLIKWTPDYKAFIKHGNKWEAISSMGEIYYDSTIKIEPK